MQRYIVSEPVDDASDDTLVLRRVVTADGRSRGCVAISLCAGRRSEQGVRHELRPGEHG